MSRPSQLARGRARGGPPRARAAACLVLGALLLLSAGSTAAAEPTDDAVRQVARQLQCPVCEGQTVADSNSGLASDMRAVIRSRLAAGESAQQVLDGFVQAYGDGILTEPPKRGAALGVWLGPPLALLLGAAILVGLLVRWSRGAPPRDPLPPAAAGPAGAPLAVDDGVAAELRRYRQEVGR